MTQAYDCQRCGACCVNHPENRSEGFLGYVAVEPRDALWKKPDLVDRYVTTGEDGAPCLKLDGAGRCHALLGALGKKVRCSIYHYRPSPCRRVEAGSALCRQYRVAQGLPADPDSGSARQA